MITLRLSSLQAKVRQGYPAFKRCPGKAIQPSGKAIQPSKDAHGKAIQPSTSCKGYPAFFHTFQLHTGSPFLSSFRAIGSIPSPVPWQHLHTLASKSMAIQPSIVQKLLCLGPRLALVELCQLGSSLQGLKVPGTTAGPTGLI